MKRHLGILGTITFTFALSAAAQRPLGRPGIMAPRTAPVATSLQARLARLPHIMKLSPKIPLAGAQLPGMSEPQRILQEQAATARLLRGALNAVRPAPSIGAGNPMLASGNTGGTLLGSSSGSGTPAGTPTAGGSSPAGMVPGGRGAARGALRMRPVHPGLTATPPPAQSKTSKLAVMAPGTRPQACMMVSSQPSVRAISGKKTAIFTPNVGTGSNPLNQYTIQGCNFGATQGQGYVQIFGTFLHHNGPVRLAIESWSDQLILASFDPNFQDEYDMNNITLTVAASNGQTVQVPGNSFYAMRASRPLTFIPKSAFAPLGSYPYTVQALIVSAANPGNLNLAGQSWAIQQASTEQWTALISHTVGLPNDYPDAPLVWYQNIAFNNLRPGFVLDPSFQTSRFAQQAGSYDSCKVGIAAVDAQWAGTTLEITEHPLECDDFGKYADTEYGLILTVTGPKGQDLNPWPEGVQ